MNSTVVYRLMLVMMYGLLHAYNKDKKATENNTNIKRPLTRQSKKEMLCNIKSYILLFLFFYNAFIKCIEKCVNHDFTNDKIRG